MKTTPLIIRQLGIQPYAEIWQAMQDFTEQRTAETVDELWLLQHPPVYTLGKAGKTEHILNAHTIPVIKTDRGGQVTYHGPGQLVGYCLVDLQRKNIGIKTLVCQLEKTIITLLKDYGIEANTVEKAPGVYVDDSKIASLGLRVRRGYTFHGLSLNVDMDLTPFSWINPCGFAGLKMSQMSDFVDALSLQEVSTRLQNTFCTLLSYDPA